MNTASTTNFLVVSRDEWTATRRALRTTEWELNRLRNALARRCSGRPWAFDGNSERAPLAHRPQGYGSEA